MPLPRPYALLFVTTVMLAAPIAVTPWLPATSSTVVRCAYHPVCHQRSERSFVVADHALPVCARCMGVYLGAVLGALLLPLGGALRRTDVPSLAWLVLAASLLGAQWTLGVLGWADLPGLRLTTGLLLGATVPWYVLPGVNQAEAILRRHGWRQLVWGVPHG